jgi:L-fuconolactonase
MRYLSRHDSSMEDSVAREVSSVMCKTWLVITLGTAPMESLLEAAHVHDLKLFEERQLVFEVVAVFPNHLKLVPTLAEKLPDLTLVIDHLAKPPIKERVMGEWAEQFAAAAEDPNVNVKVSGLNTAADWETWTAADIKPYIECTREKFGIERMMFGSDWPVVVLAGDYQKVWETTQEAIADYSADEQAASLGGTMTRVYAL